MKRKVHLLERRMLMLLKSSINIADSPLNSTHYPILPGMWIGNHKHDDQSNGQSKAARQI